MFSSVVLRGQMSSEQKLSLMLNEMLSMSDGFRLLMLLPESNKAICFLYSEL